MSGYSGIRQRLENMGCEVFFSHYRNFGDGQYMQKHEAGPGEQVLPNGGETIATIVFNGEDFNGSAICSESDTFNRAHGRQLALIRACKEMGAHGFCLPKRKDSKNNVENQEKVSRPIPPEPVVTKPGTNAPWYY